MKTIYLIILSMIAGTLFLYACFKNDKTKYNLTDGDHFDVVIVGGGISGLTAAYYLKDKKIMVLEKEELCGGRVISGSWGGYHYPKGMEYIGPPEKDYSKMFDELGLVLTEVPPPTDGVMYKGEFYHHGNILNFLPDQNTKNEYYRLMEELEQLGELTEEAIWEDQEELINFSHLDKISVEDWLNENAYHSLIQRFVDVENRGLFGAANKDLSFLFNIDEMAYDLPDSTEYNTSEVYTFQNGMFEFITAVTGKLEGKITTGAEVTLVTVNSDLGATVKYTQNGECKYLTADCVIMATPAPITAKIVKGLSDPVMNALKSVKYSKYITVNLFTSERLYKDSWMAAGIDECFVTLYDAVRTQVDTGYNGKSILGMYIAPKSADDQQLMNMPENQLLDSIYNDLEAYFPDVRNKVLGYDIQRFEYAFPVFEKNYRNTILSIQNDDSAWGPVFLCGDYMMYATFDGAFWSAVDAAAEVVKYMKEDE